MMRKWIGFILMPLLLIGCGWASASESADARVSQGSVTEAKDEVIVEGVVVPARWSYSSFQIPGKVTEVVVKEGDRVDAGALLVQLEAQALKVSLRSAQQDVLLQETALQQLLNGASDVTIARAEKVNSDQIAQVEVVLLIKQLQLEKARAEDPAFAVAAAQARVKQLQFQLAQLRVQDPAPVLVVAEVELEKARIALDETQDEYTKALDRPWEDQSIRDAWANQLEQARLNHRSAQAQFDGASNQQRAHKLSQNVLLAQVEEAKTQLAQVTSAQKAHDIVVEMLEAEIRAAELNLQALRAWDNPYRDTPSDEEIAQARTMVEKAKLAVAGIELQLQDASLVAPFAGTVVRVDVEAGDQVVFGQVAIVLAKLDRLEVRTTDLTELDVTLVEVGQPAIVTIDALPGREMEAQVAYVALIGEDYRGDVTYEVVIQWSEAQHIEALRWGMTAMIAIKVG
ncbi:MAG: biotin/lipoyl-binding protein [Anaerolineae bacterium]|nr:biotin/lipoyl-binding protein [Anaerolineae bacterium]